MQSSRCPAIPKKGSFGFSQSSRNRDLDICNPDDCNWIVELRLFRENSGKLIQLHKNCTLCASRPKHWPWSFHNHSNSNRLCADCKVIDRIARWSTGLHQNWSDCNIHEHIQVNATSDSCRTTAAMNNSDIDQSLIYCETDQEGGNNILMTCFIRNQQSHCNLSAIHEIKTGLLW